MLINIQSLKVICIYDLCRCHLKYYYVMCNNKLFSYKLFRLLHNYKLYLERTQPDTVIIKYLCNFSNI